MLTHQAIFAVYAGINGLILLVLSILVTRQRVKTKTMIMDAGKDELIRAVRAHANAAEYIPIGLLLLIAIAWLQAPLFLMHVVGTTLTLGRLLHAYGLHLSTGVTNARFIGTNLTWIAILIGSISAIVYAFV